GPGNASTVRTRQPGSLQLLLPDRDAAGFLPVCDGVPVRADAGAGRPAARHYQHLPASGPTEQFGDELGFLDAIHNRAKLTKRRCCRLAGQYSLLTHSCLMNNLPNGSFRLLRIAGITVFVHWSWILFAYIQINRIRHYQSMVWSVLEYLALFA